MRHVKMQMLGFCGNYSIVPERKCRQVLARFTGLSPSTSLLPSRSNTSGIVAQAVLSKQIPAQSKSPQAKLSLSSAGHQDLPALIKHIDFHQRTQSALVKTLGSQAARKPVCPAELGQNGLRHVTQAVLPRHKPTASPLRYPT
ncbi:hypothetical protein B0H11DRAFT_1914523 [Mycena galericulata]|nr:hypothetical protein B0H11DRAFT_1914523 [Mycena galericulata]